MVLKRKLYDRFLEWKKEGGKSALLVTGARRVGKSTLVREFGKTEYKSYVFIDFSNCSHDIKNVFLNGLYDLDRFFQLVSVLLGVELYERNSLFIFDEVQAFPLARQAIKHLVADGRFDYVETGSLISLRSNVKDIIIPSEEEVVRMYPLDFEEFAWALGKSQLVEYVKECFLGQKPLADALHKEAMLLFREYMIVGGMPQSVIAYIESPIRSFSATERVKRNILNLYKQDIMKIDGSYRSKVAAIFDQIPALLSRHEKRVIYNEIADGSSFDSYRETFFWLSESMMANVAFNSRDPEVGLGLNEDRTYVKCYMGDTGLLLSHVFRENEKVDSNLYKELYLGRLSINEGMFFENVIAQCLTASGYRLFFYTKFDPVAKRNAMEIDFILSKGGKIRNKIYPIEVKSTDRYSTKSLEMFREKYSRRIGGSYIIHTGAYAQKNGITCIPCYMAFLL